MKTYFAYLICLIAFPAATVAQQSPFSGAHERLTDEKGNLNYVAPLEYLKDNEASFDKWAYEQALATYSSFVGIQDSAKNSFLLDKGLASNVQLADPLDVIMPKARNASLVLINEAHHVPAHRAFAAMLLDSLYAAGYTILSLEALSEEDTTINSRKYPVSSSGFYTKEPTFANFIRAAIARGFTVVGHEIRSSQEKEIADPMARSNYRDSLQAVNLLATMKANPKAKVLGYVGYDHILEKERDKYKRLGAYLHDANVDALTIDQVTTCSCVAGNSPVALTSDGINPVTIGAKKGLVDIQVVHPPVTLVDGRPRWLMEVPDRKAKSATLLPFYRNKKSLVQVYDKNEFDAVGERAIPVDQFITDGSQSRLRAMVPVTVKYTLVRYKAFE
ncbi:hypothetical protein [Pontibacter oryzae]|uniref:Uncharacterized protein n=1 Tax=Pontibacter oryzae TaxID=2304593 RepID=A0A399SMA8_9BACT|nr:hypothetical protein [Pontibacter oryzae]RIJ43107.1 hypothetical protein D1627_04570 [Pontibacter oryzae]